MAILLIGATGSAAWWHLHRKHLRQLADFERERKQHAELAHASRVALLGELSASLAHELKQPLTAILSNAQAALRFLNETLGQEIGEVRDILKDIASQDRRASEIISRMRAMMKKGEAKMFARDLNADVQQALLLIHSDLVSRNVSVVTLLAPRPTAGPRRSCYQCQQVLLNLVINGCDAMHANAPEERRVAVETALDGPICPRFWRDRPWRRDRPGNAGAHLRATVLFHQGNRPGHGSGHLPGDHQSPWRPPLGGKQPPIAYAYFHFTLKLEEPPQPWPTGQ